MENYDYNTRRHRLCVRSKLIPDAATDDDADLLLLLYVLCIYYYVVLLCTYMRYALYLD